MGVKCCLCGSWTSVFQFPRRERMKERWLAACNLPEVPFRSGVCIRHFLPDDIQTALPSQRSSHVKFNAVPTLMPQPPQAQLSTVAGKRTPLVKQPPMETDISSVDNQSCLEPVASSSTAAAGQASGMKKIGSQSPCQTWSPGAQKSNPDSKTRAKSLSSGRSKRSIRLPTKVYRELQEVCISLGTTRPGAIGTLCKRYLAEGRHDTIFESSSDVDQADPERGSPGSAQSDERFDSLADSEAAYDSDVSKGELEDSDVSGTGDNTVLETDHFVGSAPSWDVRSAVVSEPQLRQLLTEMPAICQHCHREVSPDVKRQGLSYDVQWTCGRCQIITRKPWHSTEKHDDEAVFDAVFAAAVTLSGCSSTSVQRLMAAANMGTLSTNALQRITNKTVHPLIGRVNGADTDTGTVTARRPRGLAATARQQEDAQSRVPRRQHDLGDIDRPAKRACSVAEDPPTADPKENAPSSVSCDVCARAGALPTPAVPEVTDITPTAVVQPQPQQQETDVGRELLLDGTNPSDVSFDSTDPENMKEGDDSSWYASSEESSSPQAASNVGRVPKLGRNNDSWYPSADAVDNSYSTYPEDEDETTEWENAPSEERLDPTSLAAGFSPLGPSLVIIPAARTKYDKVNACSFCGKLIKQKIQRHLIMRHADEEEVKNFLKYPKGSRKRRDEVYRLMCAGNFKYNENKSQPDRAPPLIVLKRPHKDTPITEFGPCPACHGYIRKTDLWRHIKNCPCATEDERQFSNRHLTALITPADTTDDDVFQNMILSSMRNDEIRKTICDDTLLLRMGSLALENKGTSESWKSALKQRLRTLAKLLLIMRTKVGWEASLTDILQPRFFDAIIDCVKDVCCWKLGDDHQPPSFNTPGPALKVGHALKKASEVAMGEAIRSNDSKRKDLLSEYIVLHEKEWGDRISHAALSTRDLRKMNKINPLPLTDDLIKLSEGTKKRICEAVKELQEKKLGKASLVACYNHLAEDTCAAIILFNKRRGGEASRLLVAAYKGRGRKQPNQDAINSLSPLEQELGKKMQMVEMVGTRKRCVPILLCPYVVRAIDTLLMVRTSVGVPRDNPYVFARGQGRSKANMKGLTCLKAACDKVGLKNQKAVTSTNLRKYLATVTQLMDLDSSQLEWVANHLGHDLSAHRQYYRLPSGVLQVSKISQLLLASERGQIHHYEGKDLNEINVEDLLTHME